MRWQFLLAWLVLTWCAWVVAAAAERAASDAANRVPAAKRGGVSIFPAIPLFPLGFLGLAKVVDDRLAPWGSLVVATIHVPLFVAFLVSTAVSWRRLTAERRQANETPPDSLGK